MVLVASFKFLIEQDVLLVDFGHFQRETDHKATYALHYSYHMFNVTSPPHLFFLQVQFKPLTNLVFHLIVIVANDRCILYVPQECVI